MTGEMSTGMEVLDRRLDGGLQPGSVVALVAGPAMQSEALLQEIVKMRPTLYMTTVREPESIESDLARLDTDEVVVKHAGNRQTLDNEALTKLTGSRSAASVLPRDDTLLDDVLGFVEKCDQQANVILDQMNPLEETDDKQAYRDTLTKLKSRMRATGSLGVMHCITLEDVPPFRDVTLSIADVVVELDLVSTSNKSEYQIRIPKNRAGRPMLDETSLVIDSEVWLDDSRNI